MTRWEAENIINQENLKRINWYDQDNLRENQVGIKREDDYWVVYATDERASIVTTSISNHVAESEALEMLIKKARTGKILFG